MGGEFELNLNPIFKVELICTFCSCVECLPPYIDEHGETGPVAGPSCSRTICRCTQN